MEDLRGYVGIEVMPVVKSCDKGCPQCFLANIKRTKLRKRKVDKEVQRSFSIFERYLKTQNLGYDMHFPSQMHLFPKIKMNAPMRLARFGTHTSIYDKGGAKKFSEKIRELLKKYKTKPQEICFSFVPDSPLLSEVEVTLINEIMREISSWFLVGKTGKTLTCTIRTNFIPPNKLKALRRKFFRRDRKNLNAITANLLEGQHDTPGRYKIDDDSDIHATLFGSRFRKKVLGNKIKVTNRIIAHTTQKERDETIANNPKKYSFNFEVEQAFEIRTWLPHVMFVPDGVMLNHTSVAINNPILWINHSDFRKALTKHKKTHSFEQIARKLLLENIAIYNSLSKSENNTQSFLRKVAKEDRKQFQNIFEKQRKHCKFN